MDSIRNLHSGGFSKMKKWCITCKAELTKARERHLGLCGDCDMP